MSATTFVLAVAVAFGVAGGLTGKSKGGSFWLWFAISGLLPGFGFLAALAMRDETRELRRQCPSCNKVLRITDAMCMRCGADLDFPETAIAPQTRE